MKTAVYIMVVLLAVACGKKEPVFASPQDGDVLTLPGFGSFTVQLADNDYADTTIEFRGLEALNGRISCQNVANAPATCIDLSYQQTSTLNASISRCSTTNPCYYQVAITARRGDYSKTILITVQDQGYPTTQSYYRW